MWAVVAMRWELTLTEASWGMGDQLVVVVLELFLTTTAYLGILLMCMKLALLGHDLDDKACEPTVWTEEEKTQPNSQDVSRPVSPIDEEAGFGTSAEMSGSITKGPSYQASEMIGSSKNVPEMEGSSQNVVEMDAVRPTVEAEGSTQHVIEMDASRSVAEVEGSSQPLLEMEGSTKHRFEMHGSTHQALEADSRVYHQDMKGQGD